MLTSLAGGLSDVSRSNCWGLMLSARIAARMIGEGPSTGSSKNSPCYVSVPPETHVFCSYEGVDLTNETIILET